MIRSGGRDSLAWCHPILRWAGSKRSLLPELLARLAPRSGRYFEPFAGSACLFFAARPGQAVLGDLNSELIEAYRIVRSHPRLVSRSVRGWDTDPEAYYDIRALRPEDMPEIDRAARFIFLNRLCFNGLYRTNRQGHFNVPYGVKTGAFPSEAHLYRCSVALRAAELRSGDFEETIADASTDDFVYLDPPYTKTPAAAYGVFGYGGFDARDLDRIAETLQRLDRRGARFLFSYALDPELIERFPPSWRVDRVSTHGQIAARSDFRSQRDEILVSNQGSGP